MLFSSSSLLLLGVLSAVRGHPDHHHHRAIARQLAAAAAPPAANPPPSSSSLPGQAAPAPAHPTPPGSLAGPVVPSLSRSSSVSGASTSTLPDATLTATDPNIPPLSDITSGEPSPTPIFTFQATLGAPGPYPGAPPLPSSKSTRTAFFLFLFFLKRSLLSSSNPGSLQVSFSDRARANRSSPHG